MKYSCQVVRRLWL